MNQPTLRSLVLLAFLSLALCASAQKSPSSALDNLKVEFGYTATFLGDDQGATNTIFLPRGDTAFVTGSSFYGAQSGFSARANFELGSRKRFIIPIGFDYSFFSGIQRIPSSNATQHGFVSVNTFSLVAGAQYRIIDLPLAEAFLYGGVEARGSFIPGANFRYEVLDSANPTVARVEQDTVLKSSVFRFGGAVRVGCQGEISDPLFINVSVAYGVYNLLGRDLRSTGSDRRGQLLTPSRINETNEAYSKYIQLSIWLQYRL